ncbi:diaminopimelate epimerase [Pseudomonas chlororaphis]|uniref:diaminopimelate epimerase n=1 Tax=Pseudomonas chlororaphis TaxID=587753 RepID=UPI000F5835FB|nr:diaminopimelate epimerase [Pseudomonas chlororaphis]AZC81581.1 Diaminopimelate epimerase [Pseudomonas chlororaphis subsp. piscium]AZC95146.1 Diaminopimelate epimerase [Pseudomonas chlororaphis subsp. piscium]AZD78996.1 Diaminopimelate epimerase [Pseudomonas chlororaphis subsp. aurantiaca]
MPLSFQKLHANGDDFMLVDARGRDNPITSELARTLGDRHRGVGFNQLVVLSHCPETAAQLTFWNADGSSLNTCGSATRGAADLLMRESGEDSVQVKTVRGILHCLRLDDQSVSVEMGVPQFAWQEIPLATALDSLALPLPGEPAACSMGNPHCTFFVEDLQAIDVATLGPQIEAHPLFPQKTNVHFVQVIDRQTIRLRIWERNGAIPLGSGSCSCGAAVNGIRRGLLDSPVRVLCDGGPVTVSWDGQGKVQLAGVVERVFSGTF